MEEVAVRELAGQDQACLLDVHALVEAVLKARQQRRGASQEPKSEEPASSPLAVGVPTASGERD